MKLLLYCTKEKPYLLCAPFINKNKPCRLLKTNIDKTIYNCLKEQSVNGKIVAECDYEIEEIFEDNLEDARDGYVEHFYTLASYDDFDEGQKALLKESCLQKHELSNYLGFDKGYAIRLKNLHIFDKPKELTEVYKIEDVGGMLFTIPLINAPKNMGIVSVNHWKYATYESDSMKRFISIKSRELCKILNGEKIIVIRKKV